MKGYEHTISLAEFQSPHDKQYGNDCTIHATINACEVILNQYRLSQRVNKIDLDEKEAGHIVSEWMGRHESWVFVHGGNAEQAIKTFSETFIPSTKARIIDQRIVQRTKKDIVETLKSKQPIVYGGFGTNYWQSEWWIDGRGGHAMCLDTIHYNDDDTEDFVCEFFNTWGEPYKQRLKTTDDTIRKAHMFQTFKIDLNGVILPTTNLNNPMEFEHNYLEIMEREVPKDLRLFNDYTSKNDLEVQIKAMIEIMNFRSKKK